MRQKLYLTPIYPDNWLNEHEVQAIIYDELKALGLNPRLEVKGCIPPEISTGRNRCRFDVVVFWPDNHFPLCIIECKNTLGYKRNSRQFKRYSMFGLPLFYATPNTYKKTLESVIKLAQTRFAEDAPPSMIKQVEWEEYINTLDCDDD